MSDNYPPLTPKWAASIWATDAWIYLELPTHKGVAKHTVRFTNDPKGLAMALKVLQERTSSSRIGEKGDLTRWQITQISNSKASLKEFLGYNEKIVRRPKPKDTFSAEARMTAREILRKVGIL